MGTCTLIILLVAICGVPLWIDRLSERFVRWATDAPKRVYTDIGSGYYAWYDVPRKTPARVDAPKRERVFPPPVNPWVGGV